MRSLYQHLRSCGVPSLFCQLLIFLAGEEWPGPAFGQTARITGAQVGMDGRFSLLGEANVNFYYILRKGGQVTAILSAKDAQLGQLGNVLLKDPDRAEGAAGFYRVEEIPLGKPLDVDGDGIDDVYELRNRPNLDPLNPADAGLDPDGDGKTTLEEYRTGRNPFGPELPAIPAIVYPTNATTASFVMFSGSGPKGTLIRVEGGAAYVTNKVDSSGHFEMTVPLLANRLNRLFVSAVDELGQSSPTTPIDVLQDSSAPYVFIDFPTNKMVLTTESTLVAGRVGDALSGFLGLSVTVNGQNAQVDVGIGPNGTYQRGAVPLNVGSNVIEVVSTDRLGNLARTNITVIRTQPSGARLLAVSGDLQQTNILGRLGQPLTVKLASAAGTPLANRLVNFQVTRSDGRLLPVETNMLAAAITTRADYSPAGTMFLQLLTDAAGQAQAWWTMGTDAGHANDRVTVFTKETAETVNFCASAFALPAKQINVGSGNYQRGEASGPAPEPLKAWVSDGNNPVAGVPVTFRVLQGGGTLIPILAANGASPAGPGLRASRPTTSLAIVPRVEGSQEGSTSRSGAAMAGFTKSSLTFASSLPASGTNEVVVLTGITGHAEVDFTFGPEEGDQVIEATFPANRGSPALFTLNALRRTPGEPASFAGVVQDNTSQPIGGALCEMIVNGGTNVTSTDVQGRFAFPNIAAGAGHLKVNGAAARTLGTNSIPTNSFPSLQYSIVVVANAENSLPSPVLLPRLNPKNSQWYYGTNDLVVTCDAIAGLRMTIKANSMHHPGGQVVDPNHPALVSLNQVHHDDIPMPMPDGASPPFAWTLQPGGATFDFPVQVEYPNMSGLAAGAAAFFLTFNHDTERFEIVASGHVVEDGSKIVTDPGAGLTISGWGCNCPPYSVAGSCQKCTPPEPTSNGCGAAAMGGGNLFTNCGLIPPTIPGGLLTPYCFTLPCDLHDICYGTCGADKAQCDQNFLADMLDVCSKAAPNNPVGYSFCAARAYAYYNAVSIFGGNLAYVPAQAAACVCENAGPSAFKPDTEPQLAAAPGLYADDDHDILPDDWERQFGLNPTDPGDTFADPDGDGLNNFQEFFFMLNPLLADTDGDGQSDLEAARQISPLLNRPGRMDPSWRVQVGSQTVAADAVGSFRVHNISAPDEFGAGGPGSIPDAVSDDYVRVKAVGSVNGRTRYAHSEFFRIRQGQTHSITELTFSDTPVATPESLVLTADQPTLTALGQTTQVHVRAILADGTSADLTPGSAFTTYRVSNPAIARVDTNGLVTAVTRGTVFVTAVNDGTSGVVQIDVVPGALFTSVIGVVQNVDGTPAPGLTVTIPGQAPTALTDLQGRFTIPNVVAGSTTLGLLVQSAGPTGPLAATVEGLVPLPGGITDSGVLLLEPVRAVVTPPFAGGGFHALAIKKNGTLWAWGQNAVGQLGDGTFENRANPVQVGTDSDWAFVAAGERHTLALKKDGSLWGWGDNSYGQLGLSVFSVELPARLFPGNDWSAMVAGRRHSVFLKTDGTLWVAGRNDAGQLGIGNTTDSYQIVQVGTSSNWSKIAAGSEHTLALQKDGSLWAWGANFSGQLGDGTSTALKTLPTRAGAATDWSALAAGRDHSIALKVDGTLWAWGGNTYGQIADSLRVIFRNLPTRVGNSSDWTAIAAGLNHSLVVKQDKSLWAWGWNYLGQLGQGTSSDLATNLVPIAAGSAWAAVAAGQEFNLALAADGSIWTWGANDEAQLARGYSSTRTEPAQIGPDANWSLVSAGRWHSAGLKSDGSLWTWGFNYLAELGNGTKVGWPVPIQVGTDKSWSWINTFESHTLALKNDGSLWGWGYNADGQVGNGSTTDQLAPVRIGSASDWAGCAAGHSHSAAVKTDGTLWTWGMNNSGQLGNGLLSGNRSSPAKVGSNTDWAKAAAGTSHTLALKKNGTLWGWGNNARGQLGRGKTSFGEPTPEQVGSDTDWSAMAAGNLCSVALKSNGSLWAWGENVYGQIGDGTGENRLSPVRVGSANDWLRVEVGDDHVLAVKNDGSLWAWGKNADGEVGDGTRESRLEPVRLGAGNSWSQVAGGEAHSLAVRSDGTLWGWGSNRNGQLGDPSPFSPGKVGTSTDWGKP